MGGRVAKDLSVPVFCGANSQPYLQEDPHPQSFKTYFVVDLLHENFI